MSRQLVRIGLFAACAALALAALVGCSLLGSGGGTVSDAGSKAAPTLEEYLR